MKVCPKCDRDYGDEAGFCLIDGTALVDGDTMPTVAIGGGAAEPTLLMPAAKPTKRSKVPLIITAIVGMLILTTISALLLSKMMRKGNAVSENQNRLKNTASQTPTAR